ncbi:MAG: hypothetical protein ACI4VN_03620 [Clostridia bacterium]|nr:hypothetical protein [Clostridia bacterium]
MKKNIVVVLLVLLICVAAIAGIFLYNKEHKVIESKNEVKELVKENATIEDFKKKLDESELKIDLEAENTECDLIGASEGMSYTIDDALIQVYKFDFNNSNELTVSNLKLAQDQGKVVMPSFNNYEFKVVYNKGLILVNSEDHPDKDRIVELFMSL